MRTPSEDFESAAFSRWIAATYPNLKPTHIPDGAYMNIATAKRMERLGVKRGVPDHMIVDPKDHAVLWIEMKRSNKSLSKVSPEQLEWIAALGPDAHICYGFKEAQIKVLEWIDARKSTRKRTSSMGEVARKTALPGSDAT